MPLRCGGMVGWFGALRDRPVIVGSEARARWAATGIPTGGVGRRPASGRGIEGPLCCMLGAHLRLALLLVVVEGQG